MSNSRSSQILLDVRFDLDEALACCAATTTTVVKTTTTSSKSSSTVVVFEEIPTVKVGDDSVCCVCMESFRSPNLIIINGTAKQLPCGHVYHPDCIRTWISSCDHDSCPLCRQLIVI